MICLLSRGQGKEDKEGWMDWEWMRRWERVLSSRADSEKRPLNMSSMKFYQSHAIHAEAIIGGRAAEAGKGQKPIDNPIWFQFSFVKSMEMGLQRVNILSLWCSRKIDDEGRWKYLLQYTFMHHGMELNSNEIQYLRGTVFSNNWPSQLN